MTRIIFIALLAISFLAAGQDTPKKPPMPEFTYVTPQMTKKQLDSVSIALKQYDVFLVFDTVIYDANKRIKEVAGGLDTNSQYFPVNSTNFKGMTIISRGDSLTLIMGLLPPPKK